MHSDVQCHQVGGFRQARLADEVEMEACFRERVVHLESLLGQYPSPGRELKRRVAAVKSFIELADRINGDPTGGDSARLYVSTQHSRILGDMLELMLHLATLEARAPGGVKANGKRGRGQPAVR